MSVVKLMLQIVVLVFILNNLSYGLEFDFKHDNAVGSSRTNFVLHGILTLVSDSYTESLNDCYTHPEPPLIPEYFGPEILYEWANGGNGLELGGPRATYFFNLTGVPFPEWKEIVIFRNLDLGYYDMLGEEMSTGFNFRPSDLSGFIPYGGTGTVNLMVRDYYGSRCEGGGYSGFWGATEPVAIMSWDFKLCEGTHEFCCFDTDGDHHYAEDGSCPEGDDFDDSYKYSYPGAPEICDHRDNDNNGLMDDGIGCDYDGDGYYLSGDCNDDNVGINPGAREIYFNNVDENCNGMADDEDYDPKEFQEDEDCLEVN
jgi:hypothetical protein